MNLKKISQSNLSFDPLKPIILRGPPTEESKTVLSGNVVLTLSKSTKISNIAVTFKCTATTYWPEGIGVRGTRLTSEKVLSEETLVLMNETKYLSEGVHRLPFGFLVPNSVVESIDDVYGRVRHTIEARASRPGISLLNSWHSSKTVLVLRTYMSNSLLTNNTVQDLSRTLEKRIGPADIQVIIEQAAFSAGEAFHIRSIIQPQMKHVRLEHMDVVVTEHYRYLELEMRAQRNGHERFPFQFRASTSLLDESTDTTDQVQPIFSSSKGKLLIGDTFAHRLTFATPTCHQNIHHTSTHYREIQFRHYITIKLTLSFPNEGDICSMHPLAPEDIMEGPLEHHTPAIHDAAGSGSWQHVLSKFKVSRDKSKDKRRIYDTIVFDVPITVFDCRLKEDFGRLPSYFELGVTPRQAALHEGKKKKEKSKWAQPEIDKPNELPHTYLCDCYHDFARQMQYASQTPFLVTSNLPLERVPSLPPPEYEATKYFN
ncbi:hypothetical protein RO3G_04152 [Lichtheimia corymbifera JMRC:FSU:9682]|uniref:Arrestin-like N-terminal domain-containing protein n=1 Tax=Lichtheimia corymbifera JMRC:FSU:9682 TaxID=1263082 RepID=A0A068RXS7_9FUNG|nr:hypothetical protein RO3G_04152 [Lichtheimia corymbifera JMRC:FSU:9682]